MMSPTLRYILTAILAALVAVGAALGFSLSAPLCPECPVCPAGVPVGASVPSVTPAAPVVVPDGPLVPDSEEVAVSTVLVLTYTARFASPELIERGKAQRLTCEIQYGGAVIRPVSGTLTIRDGGNVSVVDAAAVTVGDDDGIAYYDLAAATVPDTMAVSQHWLVEWTLTFADGQVHTFRRPAHLCLRRLYPVATVNDVVRRHRADLQQLLNRGQDLQSYGDDAWDTLMFRFLGGGREPQKVMSPDRFAEVHKALWLHRIFLDATLNGEGDKYAVLADYWGKQYEVAWTDLRITFDRNEDNLPPNPGERGEAANPPLMLSAGPVGRWRYGGRV